MAKGKRWHIYSKMTNGVNFHDFRAGGADLPTSVGYVSIPGGTGIANKHLITPLGIHVEVTQDQMDFLNKDGHFQEFVKKGFIIVGNSFEPIEKMVSNMTEEPDKSAPLTPADYGDESDVKVK